MRYIKDLPNDYCKAGLYAWNNKYIIKFEAGMYEQTYKISETDLLSEDDIDDILGDTFMKKVAQVFEMMHKEFELALDSLD